MYVCIYTFMALLYVSYVYISGQALSGSRARHQKHAGIYIIYIYPRISLSHSLPLSLSGDWCMYMHVGYSLYLYMFRTYITRPNLTHFKPFIPCDIFIHIFIHMFRVTCDVCDIYLYIYRLISLILSPISAVL